MSFNPTWAKILGWVLLLVGVVGFFTGDMLFGFGINMTHNLVHVITGLLALWAGYSGGGAHAKTYNIVFGIIYLLVAVLGFLSVGFVVDLLALNAADNWLHLVIGVVTTAIGFWG